MPAIYAHDKFGKMVLKQLPYAEQAVIRKYPRSFRIGLQGPDFMFFYRAFRKNSVNQKGVFYHHQDAFLLMEKAVEVIETFGKNSSQYSYVLGLICHFTLDSICHPYVAEAMEVTGCSHGEIEGDFESMLMEQDGLKPHLVRVFKLVPTDKKTAESIQPFYPDFSRKKIQRCLQWMRGMKRFLYAPGNIKRLFLKSLMLLTGHYSRLKGHLMFPKPNRKCRERSKHLYVMLREAVSKGVFLIDNFSKACEGEKLDEFFHRNFSGKCI